MDERLVYEIGEPMDVTSGDECRCRQRSTRIFAREGGGGYRLAAPDGWYALRFDPGCHHCERPIGILIEQGFNESAPPPLPILPGGSIFIPLLALPELIKVCVGDLDEIAAFEDVEELVSSLGFQMEKAAFNTMLTYLRSRKKGGAVLRELPEFMKKWPQSQDSLQAQIQFVSEAVDDTSTAVQVLKNYVTGTIIDEQLNLAWAAMRLARHQMCDARRKLAEKVNDESAP